MTDHDKGPRKPASGRGCLGCLGVAVLLAAIAFGPSSIIAAAAGDSKGPVLPLIWAVPVTVAAFVVAELLVRRLAERAGTGDEGRTPLGPWWMRLACLPIFLVHGLLAAGASDWPGSITTVLAAVLGVLLAVTSLLVAWTGRLPIMLTCVAAFAAWAAAALTTGPGYTALTGGALIAVLLAAGWLQERTTRSRPAT
ncbi:hypothetical protein ABZ806_19180 [Spirillospora sp. NPDC047418]